MVTCKECGKDCNVKTIDEGIGPYEFWGAKGNHHDYRRVTDCCEVDFEGEDPGDEEPDYDDTDLQDLQDLVWNRY